MMSEPEIGSMPNLEKNSQLGAKAEADDETIIEAKKGSIPEAKASTAHEGQSNDEALRYAALTGHVELCKLMLKHGVNLNTSTDGSPILVASAEAGNLEVVKVLVESGAAINATDSDNKNALHRASMKGHKALVAFLLDHGGDFYHVDKYGVTPIHLVAHFGYAEIVQLLIDSGADLECVSSTGWTPLHLCYDKPEMAHVLLRNGADVNSVARNGCTPLYFAVRSNNPEVVKVLLSYNPDLEITERTSERNYSALTAATLNGNAKVIRLLLEAGANVNHRSEENKFPLLYAAGRNMENVLRMIMEYNPKFTSLTNMATRRSTL